MIATDRNGDQLLIFRPGVQKLEEHPDLPLIFACVVARYQGRVLYVLNTWRHEWELPAGRIDTGDNASQTAIRELREESCQEAEVVNYVGLSLLWLERQQMYELGAIFTAEIETLQPFIPNAEASAMMLWDSVSPVEGHVNILGQKLAELVHEDS